MPTGQGLADLLSGAAGAPVNRPQLNAFVANSQATNSLRSAQTEEALLNAQRAQEEQNAAGELEDAFVKSGARPSDAHLMAVAAKMHAGSAVNAMDMFKAYNATILGDPSKLNTPDQTAASQAISGKLEGPQTLPNNYSLPAGVAPPTVGQSPQGAAQTADTQSQADLREAQAKAGGFNPHTGGGGGPIDPNEAAYGAYTLYKTGKMLPMGMGNAPMRNAFIAGAAQLSQREANGENVANPGFDTAIANGQDFIGAQRALNSATGGTAGNQTRSINNAVGHMQLMEGLFGALQNGDVQLANKLGNQWTKAFGAPAPTNIQTAAEFIGPELTKILSANGSAGTGEERQAFSHNAANLANAPEQTGQAIGTLKNMLGRQLTDLALQYHGATGRSDFARRYVAPDVARYLEVDPQGGPTPQGGDLANSVPQLGGGVQGPTPSPTTSVSPAGGAATTLPPQALQALQAHPGQHVTFGNGQVWTLQNGKPTRVQ
jgi:hypothetical protein